MPSVTVTREGAKWSAWRIEDDGTQTRLSPTWLRDVLKDLPGEVELPHKRPLKGTYKVVRTIPTVVGQEVVSGESMIQAVARAHEELKRIVALQSEDKRARALAEAQAPLTYTVAP